MKLFLIAGLLIANLAFAAKVGDPAPDFSATDLNGKPVALSQYKGKYVVLEWHNKECPYVKAQYGAHRMQKLQKEWTGKGVVWLEVVSSAPGKQGFVDAKTGNQDMKATGAAPTTMVLDSDGKMGHVYGAQTTPHMFVVDPQGKLIYNGGIDDKPATDVSEVSTSQDFVSLALNESMAGKSLSHPTSKPYGCGVKYN